MGWVGTYGAARANQNMVVQHWASVGETPDAAGAYTT